MASGSLGSEQSCARGVKKNHHGDNWLVAAATRSSDANFQQRADCWKGETFHTETVVPTFFFAPQRLVFFKRSEKPCIFENLYNLLEVAFSTS